MLQALPETTEEMVFFFGMVLIIQFMIFRGLLHTKKCFSRTCHHGFFIFFVVVVNTLKKLPAFWAKLLLVTVMCETSHYRLKYQEIIGWL